MFDFHYTLWEREMQEKNRKEKGLAEKCGGIHKMIALPAGICYTGCGEFCVQKWLSDDAPEACRGRGYGKEHQSGRAFWLRYSAHRWASPFPRGSRLSARSATGNRHWRLSPPDEGRWSPVGTVQRRPERKRRPPTQNVPLETFIHPSCAFFSGVKVKGKAVGRC